MEAEYDRSITASLYCNNCRRRTEHFGDMTPEGEVVFFQCLRCRSITAVSSNHRESGLTVDLEEKASAIQRMGQEGRERKRKKLAQASPLVVVVRRC